MSVACAAALEWILDMDGICDDIDDCVGTYDACGVCNGDDSTCTVLCCLALRATTKEPPSTMALAFSQVMLAMMAMP